MIHQELETLLKPVVEDLGCELWACEYIFQGKHSVLRIYIDKPEGIHIEDCERVSREVSVLLDVQSPITDALKNYTLEVSSPGLDRPLLKEEHFREYTGHHILVKLRNPVDKRRKLTGKLVKVCDDGMIVLEEHDGKKNSQPVSQMILMADIVKANIIDKG